MIMSKKLFLTAVAALSLLSAPAQINSPGPQGYMARARAMYDAGNYAGCLQQLRQADISPESRFLRAMAAYRQGDADAAQLLDEFISDFPSSPLMPEAVLAAGNIRYDRADWAAALAIYDSITPAMLNDGLAQEYNYHRACCLLQNGEADAADGLFKRLLSSKKYANEARFYTAYVAYGKKDYKSALELFKKVTPTATAPTNMTDFYLSQLYYNDKDWSKAYTTASRLLTLRGIEPQFMAEATRVAGEAAFGLGQTDKAVSYLRRYQELTAYPLPSALYVLGVSEYENGDYEDAAARFARVAELDNAMGQSAALYLGQCYMQEGNYDSALPPLDRAYRQGYDPAIQEVALYNYAVARMKGGKVPFGSSVATFEQFLRRYPTSQFAPEVQQYIITGYMTDNNYEAALASINAIKNPTSATLDAKQQVLYTLGTRYMATGEVNKAMNALREAKGMTGRNAAISAECDLWMGEILFKQGKFGDAVRCYNDYLRDAPRNAANRPLANYDLGYALFGEKKFGDAYNAFRKFTESKGNTSSLMLADAYNRMADCEYYNSDFAKAAALYDKAYDTDPGAGDYALYQKAVMKGLRRDHKGKIAGLQQMMEQFPTSGLYPSALLETAEAYTELDNNAKAIETYTLLTEKFPSTAQGRQGLLLLAITHLSGGNRDEAMSTYRQVITLYPSSDEARVAAEDLKKIYVEDDRASEFLAFMKSVPDAPEVDPSEIESLTFTSAEHAFNADGSTRKVEAYLRDYPEGRFVPQASLMMAKAMAKAGEHRKTIAYTLVVVDRYPHASVAEEALLLKAEAESALDMDRAALDSYRRLESVASSAAMLNAARLGIIRASRNIDDPQTVLEAADALLSSTTVGANERDEVCFARAQALSQLERDAEARQAWRELSQNLSTLYGTKAAFALAADQFQSNELAEARATVENLIDANPPYNYWMARAFILLSDINRAEGNSFEADEYLRSLRENYPGKETDIFTMIDQRLQ